MNKGLAETDDRQQKVADAPSDSFAAQLRQFEGHRTGWALRVWRTSVGISSILHIILFLLCAQIQHFMRLPVAPLPGSRQTRTRLYFPAELVARAATKGGNRQGKDLIGENRAEAPKPVLRVPALSDTREKKPGRSAEKPPAPKPESAPAPAEVAQATKLPESTPPQIEPTIETGRAAGGPAGNQANGDAVASGQAPATQTPPARMKEKLPMPGTPSIVVPNSSVSEIVRQMAKGNSDSPGVVISGDGAAPTLNAPPQGAKANLKPIVELKSDPQGTDFKPYLTQILAIVRKNWFTVLPRSAQMGTLRGSTVIQFVLNRDGSIPKLVIADSSGLQPLDRAAIAGLSMSNPLPPLPSDFKGGFIRLQFVFNYNIQGN